MPYTTPHTITPGELVTVATMNNEWGGNAAFLANPPACRLVTSGALSHTSSASWYSLPFDQESYDTNGMHSTSSNTTRITIQTAGLYLVSGNFEFAGNATGNRGIQVLLGGATGIAGNWGPAAASPIGTGLSVATVYKFAAGNYVELQAYQSSGGTLAIQFNNGPAFSATWLGLG